MQKILVQQEKKTDHCKRNTRYHRQTRARTTRGYSKQNIEKLDRTIQIANICRLLQNRYIQKKTWNYYDLYSTMALGYTTYQACI